MNTLRLIRWRGERHASITQRLNFAAHATPEATLALVYAHESGLGTRRGSPGASGLRRQHHTGTPVTAGIILLMVVSGLI